MKAWQFFIILSAIYGARDNAAAFTLGTICWIIALVALIFPGWFE